MGPIEATRGSRGARGRALHKAIAGLLLLAVAGAAAAQEHAHPVSVDTGTLPALGNDWKEVNPYRDDAQAARVGQSVYEQACARCHGEGATGAGVAPDLRRLDGYCKRLAEGALRQRCLGDVDDYFRRTVLFGKVRVGIVHMPPWQGHLTQEQVWAVKAFVETRGR